MLTSRKTSHGPQKSIITAPSEIRKATGILPWVGGLSGFAKADGLLASGAVAAPGSDSAKTSLTSENTIAAIKLNRATLLSNSFRVLVCSFMTGSFSGTGVGSNDNYHQISATCEALSDRVVSAYSFDFRMPTSADLVPGRGIESDAVCSFQPGCRNVDRLLGELPGRDKRA